MRRFHQIFGWTIAMRRNLSLPLVLAAFLMLCGNHALARDRWIKIQSKNFTLIGNASEGDMRKIALKLEAFRETLSLMFPNAKVSTHIPTRVVLFKSDDAFRPFKLRYKGKIQENVGGYFLQRERLNYIVLATDKRTIDPYEVIFHEYEHFVLENNQLHLPPWLDEGLAEFYSSFEMSDDNQKFKLGLPLAPQLLFLRDHTILPLKTLLLVDRKSPYYNEETKASVFYSESWALVHYLMLGNDQKRQAQLVRYMDLVSAGAPVDESFQKAFLVDYKTIEDELRAYILRAAFPLLTGTFHNQVSFDKDMQSTELSDAEALYYQGDLLLNIEQVPEAAALLEKSSTLDAKFAPSRISLGVVRMIQDKGAEAEKLFQSAIEIDPANYLAHYHYAVKLVRDGHYEAGIKEYKQAISLKADDAGSYSQLGYAYLKTGNETEAIETFKQGVRVNPLDSSFYRSLGYLYLAQGNGEFAANDANSYLRLEGWQDDLSPYMALVWYFALRQSGNDSAATTKLQESLAKIDPSEWPFPVLRFLNHSLTLSEMLAQAKDNDKLTEAHAYAGLELSLSGKHAEALEQLRWVKENGNKDFDEYALAIAEIARLEKASTTKP
jgi:tetratricopeptide (TPR) repeat protein